MKKIIVVMVLMFLANVAVAGGSCKDYGETGVMVSVAYSNDISKSIVSDVLLAGLSPKDASIARGIVDAVYTMGWDEPSAVRKIIKDLCNNGWK